MDDDAIRAILWERIAKQIDPNETPLEQARFWLLLGMRMHEADPAVADRVWRVMIPDPQLRAVLQAKLDQMAAMMGDLFESEI